MGTQSFAVSKKCSNIVVLVLCTGGNCKKSTKIWQGITAQWWKQSQTSPMDMTSLLDYHLSDVIHCGLDSDEIVRKNARTNAHTQIHSIFTLEWHAQRCLGKQGVLKRLRKQFFKNFRNISCIILHFRDPQCCLIAHEEVHELEKRGYSNSCYKI